MAKSLVEKYLEDPMHLRLYMQEGTIMAVTDLLEQVMEAEDISRAELAKKLGKSKGWVTQLLDGEANKTVRTITDVLAVLGYELTTAARPIRARNRGRNGRVPLEPVRRPRKELLGRERILHAAMRR